MLRDVVVHLHNEQPVLVDLLFEPAQTDTVVICRNMRTMNGKKPVFVDDGASTFIIPLAHIRFVEVHRSSIEAFEAERAARAELEGDDETSGPGALDRLGWLGDRAEEPANSDETALVPVESPDPEGLDDDLLRRIRDV